MPSQKAKRELAFYHQNEALLFQFILHEALEIYNVISSARDLKNLIGIYFDGEENKPCWKKRPGHLQKLQNYHALFMAHFDKSSLPSKVLEKSIGSTIEILARGKNDSLDSLVKRLKNKIKKIAASLSEILLLFPPSENSLLFLLLHLEACEDFFGKGFIKKVLEKLFPGGIEESKQFLLKNYTSRGFLHLLTPIQEKIEKVKSKRVFTKS